ncbi:hypothetical protein LSAT2_022178 [Lamellibrachia satsuma]|nr:hypothetical protein LSAT2_022178 [Lamellibrachia satsuma]
MVEHPFRFTSVMSAFVQGVLLACFVSRVHLATIRSHLPQSTGMDSFTISVNPSPTKPEDLQAASNTTYDVRINGTEATGVSRTTEAADSHTFETVDAFTTPVPDMTSHEANHNWFRNVTAVANNVGTTTSVEFLNSTFADERNQSTDPTIENTSRTSDVEVQFTTEPEDIQPASNATYDDRIYSTEATGFNGATEASDNHTGETAEAFTTPVPDMTSHEANHSLLRNMTAAANNDGTTTSVEFLNSTFADGRNQSTDPTIGNTSTTTDVEVQVTTEPCASRLSTTAESETETSKGTTLLKTTIVPSMNSTGTETSNNERPVVMCHVCSGVGCGASISGDVSNHEVCRSTSGTCWMTYDIASKTASRGCESPDSDATCESTWPNVRRVSGRCHWCCTGQRCNDHSLSTVVCPPLDSASASLVNGRITCLGLIGAAIIFFVTHP